jgi:hypothetical protein
MADEDIGILSELLDVTPATVRRLASRSVTLPDGRVIWGKHPGASAVRLPEHRLRDALAHQLGGITEAVLPYGRADVLTAESVFEVEPLRQWRAGVRQVLSYSAQTGLPPSLALFGRAGRDDVLAILRRLNEDQPPVMLWWSTDSRWEQISTTRASSTLDGGWHDRP